jgi:membrane protease YdiL (CAAX protease family)
MGRTMQRFNSFKSSIVLATFIVLLDITVGTFVTFHYYFPFADKLLSPLAHNDWEAQGLNFFVQILPEIVVPIILYRYIVKPNQFSPLIPKPLNYRSNTIVTGAVILGVCMILIPFQVLWSPSVLVGARFMVVAWAEEWTFRGVLIRLWRDKVGILWGTFIVSILFGFSHWEEDILTLNNTAFSLNWFIQMGLQIVGGIVFTIIAWRSRSIWWVVFIHCLADWQPWTIGTGSPWPSDGIVAVVIGLVGAEIIRRFGSKRAKGNADLAV